MDRPLLHFVQGVCHIINSYLAYLASKGHPAEVVNRMYDAWWKAVILQVTLWSQPYIRDGDF